MRTTVVLNDKLVMEAKRLAAENNTSLSAIINEALRERLHRAPAASEARFRMPTYGGEGSRDVTPEELSRIGEDDDFGPAES